MEFAFEETVMLGADQAVGNTSIGGRNIVPITGGTFEGDHLKGNIMPGGWDWQLLRTDGCRFLHADYMLKTEDGTVINVVNQGASCPNADGSRAPIRTMAVFEPPLGPYEWLGKSAFIGTLQAIQVDGKRAVHIRFYRVR